MSLVYYGYRVDKEDLWIAVDQIRKIYKEEHHVSTVVHELCNGLEEKDEIVDGFEKLRKLIDETVSHMRGIEGGTEVSLVRLQLYDIGDGEYSFRVLEPGYFFMNVVADQVDEIEEMYYDNRTDVTEEEKAVVDEVDKVSELQDLNRYMLVPIFETGDIYDIYMERGKAYRSE